LIENFGILYHVVLSKLEKGVVFVSTFVPESSIRCENCNESFYKYVFITNVIDTDKNDELAHEAISGKVNRVTCPFCKAEFTYENPLLLHSYVNKTAAFACADMLPVKSRNFSLAARISGACDWNFRLCGFANEASEKIRIAKDGLKDSVIELLKVKFVEEYKFMRLDDEYITYDSFHGNSLLFTKRNDRDDILEEYLIPNEHYTALCSENITVPTGDWISIDRSWAIKFLEDRK